MGWLRKRKNKERNAGKESQNRYISPPRGGALLLPICTKFNEFVDLSEVITLTKFGFEIVITLTRPGDRKKHFSFRKPSAYMTLPCTRSGTD